MSDEEDPPDDLSRADSDRLHQLDWSEGERLGSLRVVIDEVVRKADESIGWYVRSRGRKKRAATFIRFTSIALGMVAALLSILAQIYNEKTDPFLLEPARVSVPIAISAGLIALDSFFGFSKGWIRYTTTELKIRTSLNDFNLGWLDRFLAWGDGPPTIEQTEEALGVCRAFVAKLDQIVAEETSQWAADFQASLKELDAANKAAREAAQKLQETARAQRAQAAPGSLNLEVTNGDRCDGAWEATVDDGAAKRGSGKTASFYPVPAGNHVVRAVGQIGGADKVAEKAVKVAGGEVVEVSLTLA